MLSNELLYVKEEQASMLMILQIEHYRLYVFVCNRNAFICVCQSQDQNTMIVIYFKIDIVSYRSK